MEKTLIIDGKEIRFKSTGATALRYKQQFGRDPLQDVYKLLSAYGNKEESLEDQGIEEEEEEIELTKPESLDLEMAYNFAWVFAKTADKEIPSPMDWLDSFDEFPIFDILPELMDMISSTFVGSVKSKKK